MSRDFRKVLSAMPYFHVKYLKFVSLFYKENALEKYFFTVKLNSIVL